MLASFALCGCGSDKNSNGSLQVDEYYYYLGYNGVDLSGNVYIFDSDGFLEEWGYNSKYGYRVNISSYYLDGNNVFVSGVTVAPIRNDDSSTRYFESIQGLSDYYYQFTNNYNDSNFIYKLAYINFDGYLRKEQPMNEYTYGLCTEQYAREHKIMKQSSKWF